MTNEYCRDFEEQLVEYADGDLPPAEARRIADHVSRCGRCRLELQLLRRSLELAQQIWQETGEASEEHAAARLGRSAAGRVARGRAAGVDATAAASRRSHRSFTLATIAACAILLLAIGLVSLLSLNSVDMGPALTHEDPVAGAKEDEPADEQELVEVDQIDDFERWIARHEQAARLAVAVEFLAAEPELEAYRQQAERYLATTYGGPPGDAEEPPF